MRRSFRRTVRPTCGLQTRVVRSAKAAWKGTSRRLAVVLLSCLLLSSLGAAASAHPATFPDVPPANVGHDAVEYLAAADVLSGYPDQTFRPAHTVSRGQAAKVLVRQRGVPTNPDTHRYGDVDSVYAAYFEAAVPRGWIKGYPDGTYRAYEPLQRQHMAVIMVRSLGWEDEALGLTLDHVKAALAGIADIGSVVPEFRPYVALSVSRGLFKGDANGLFRPAAGITREQFALVAYRAELRGLAVYEGVRFSGDHPDKTRVVVDLSARPGSPSSRFQHGDLVVDLPGAVITGGVRKQEICTPEVDSIQSSQFTYRPQVVRFTLSLKRFSRVKTMLLDPSEGRGYRLVIDIFRRAAGPPGGGPPLVVLDAGHGGQDPGAIGAAGTKEKELNLTIVLALDGYLRQAGLRTLLTREGDSYPSLDDRTKLANEAKASLFLSVHNNASADPISHGTETFYYWGDGSERSQESKRLAEAIQRNLLDRIGSADRGAKTHWNRLRVLADTNMPAALVEVGFVTNPEEEALLNDPDYQRSAALGIAEGVLEYLRWELAQEKQNHSPSSAVGMVSTRLAQPG